ncbi:ankyrin [Massarina eburnea CBS 473.64]|uniref:Ankyrin n=1 Tax=Massarina eburnea CBS 473.64 TaxID=1395130 RepID=A0A6A6RWJ2_9PLEO|nr:ankyrin [Massarina eburnea CBS 473.64]
MTEHIFQCTQCSKTYRARNRYNQHLKTHSKPNHCERCEKRFARHSDLIRHLRARHRVGNTRYPCQYPGCEFKATRRDNLRQHRENAHVRNENRAVSEPAPTRISQSVIQKGPEIATPDVQAHYVDVPWILSTAAILEAATVGKTDILESAWRSNATSLQVRGDDGSTPLHCAARGGHSATVFRLLEMGASLKNVNGKKRTPLNEAILGQDLETIEVLLRAGSSIDAVASKRQTIEYVMQHGSTDLVQLLVRNISGEINNKVLMSVLFLATAYGQTQAVKTILSQHHIDVNKVFNKQSLLHDAAKNGHEDIFRLLATQTGANINANRYFYMCGRYQWVTPLLLAAKYGHDNIVRFLLAFENIRLEDHEIGDPHDSPAWNALYMGHTSIAYSIVQYSQQKSNVPSNFDEKASHGMASPNSEQSMHPDDDEVVELLLQISRRVRAYNPWEYLEICIETKKGIRKLLENLLQETKLNLEARGRWNAPIYTAARFGNIEATKLLLQHKYIDPNWQGSGRGSALCSALEGSHLEIAQLLLNDERVDVNIIDYFSSNGETALDMALKKNQTKMIDLLLSRGALTVRQIEDLRSKK